MNAFLAVVLVCAASVPAADCNRDNALDLVTRRVGVETACLLEAQQLAAASLSEALTDGRYLRFDCMRLRLQPAGEP